MQSASAQHLDNTVSQHWPVQKLLLVFRQFGRTSRCCNCLNIPRSKLITPTGLSPCAFFQTKAHAMARLRLYRTCAEPWPQYRQTLTDRLVLPSFFHSLHDLCKYPEPVTYDKQERAIITPFQQCANYFVIALYNYREKLISLMCFG